MINIFMGFHHVVLEEMLASMKVDKVILEKNPLNLNVIDICGKNNIPYAITSGMDDILQELSSFSEIGICLVAGFGTILKDPIIKKCKTIINFHPADVKICRGRHAFPQSLLNKYSSMVATAHIIDSEKIDAGPILAQLSAPIDYDKSYEFNDKRMINLFKSLTNFIFLDYGETHKFVSESWEAEKSAYYKPIQREIFLDVIKSSNLKKTLESLD